MAMDPYAYCPCGSGKKFRWCCQDIYAEIDQAFALHGNGQHEAAIRAMDELVKKHPTNPEAFGRQAGLLYTVGRVEEAEQALQKAFEINPDYPFGLFLRGQFRENEGEIAGALLLYRKAADRYHPEAREILAQVYMMIAESEMKLNRPVAARAALDIMLHLSPNEEVRQSFEKAFGDESRMPLVARRKYTFLTLLADASAERRANWEEALQRAATGRLRDAVAAFEQLTAAAAEEPAVWFNLALTHAWLGDNGAALDALDRYVALEQDEARASHAWSLAEVLRQGQGMEDRSDYVQHTATFQIRQAEAFFQFFGQLDGERRLFGVMTDENRTMITGIVLEKVTALTASVAALKPARVGAFFLAAGNIFQLRNTDSQRLDAVVKEVQQRAGMFLSPPDVRRGPAAFADVAMGALAFPLNALSEDDARNRIRRHVEEYFEEAWLNRPLKALGNVSPAEAAKEPGLRKKLAGVVQFQQDCLALGQEAGYDFNRLRRKLGLLEGEAAPPATAPVETSTGPDIGSLGVGELGALAAESLSDEQLETAFQTANRLDARDLTKRFGEVLVSRPVSPARPDRFPVWTKLVDHALAERDFDTALTHVDEGEKADCEHNEGRRRNDFELRRGQVLAKRGDTEAARDVFQRLFDRVPSELRYRGSGTEAMLSARQGAAALAFAEQGLAEARKQQNRDSEGYFLELAAAARKLTG